MNKFLLYTLLLISSAHSGKACAEWYPENEHLRFKLFNAELFCKCSFSQYRYTAKYFFETPESGGCSSVISEAEEQNIGLWRRYFGDKFSRQDIYSALYELQISNEGANSQNAFVRFLYLKNNQEALTYFLLMQKCGVVNNLDGDPWERNEDLVIEKKMQLLETLQEAAEKVNGIWFKKRYAFLAIRLSYYLDDTTSITSLYNQYFKNKKQLDIVDYWALYFYCINEVPGPQRNLHVAMVFRYAPDKRLAIHNYYTKKVDLISTLALAKSKEEENAVHLMELVLSVGPAITSIQALLENGAAEELTDFAINRELSKIEDWIGTVYYSNFSPSISNWYEGKQMQVAQLERDKIYANRFLQLLKSKLQREELKRLGVQIAYLEVLTRQFSAALVDIDAALKKGNLNTAQQEIANEIKALALLAVHGNVKEAIPQFCQKVLQNAQQEQHNHFLFAMAKELEAKGITTQAAALLAKVNVGSTYSSFCFWRSQQVMRDSYADYFDNYFFYLNSCYSVEAMQTMVNDLEKPAKGSFDSWLKKELYGNRFRLYDLTGTKYMRASDYKNALIAFRHVPDSVWNNGDYAYNYYLNANPFYTNAYNEHTPTKADTVRYTKTEIVEKLIDLLEKAKDPKNKNNDYAAFLAANCFLNISYYGNSWMMSNYYWSTYLPEEVKVADADFFTCSRAKTYYLQAMNSSKDEGFKALCLRMAGRCEKYKLLFEEELKNKGEYDDHLNERVFKNNAYYKLLKRNYPQYYDDLISNCESFDRFFMARKNAVITS